MIRWHIGVGAAVFFWANVCCVAAQAARPTEARAADFGYDPADATRALQSAIDSGAARVIVSRQQGPWIVDKIQLADEQEIFFEPGVEVLAKAGAFHGVSDALFTGTGRHNIRLIGPGATLRMRRADYDDPAKYKKSEWRHVLNFHGCENVTIEGLTLAESGGDGIYLGSGAGHQTNRHVVIRNVICDRNYRQGISVISADDLLIEHCTLSNTKGTAPAAGIDFEPNHPAECLTNCVMRDCVIADNHGLGIHLYLGQLDGTTTPVSIRIEKCITRGTNARSASVAMSRARPAAPLRGNIEFADCRFEDAPDHVGVNLRETPADGASVRFANCTIGGEDSLRDDVALGKLAPIELMAGVRGTLPVGNVEFADCDVRTRRPGSPIGFDLRASVPLRGIRGRLRVWHARGQTPQTMQIDQTWVDQQVPSNAFFAIAAYRAEAPRLADAAALAGRFPAHRLRDSAAYLVHAHAGQDVSFRLAYQRMGKTAAQPITVRVTDPAGKAVAEKSLEIAQDSAISFKAETDGPFLVACTPQNHTVQMLACSHAVSLIAESGRFHFVHTAGNFFFRVPAGVKTFGLRFYGEGDAERVDAVVRNAAGEAVWQQAAIGQPAVAMINRPNDKADEIWAIELRAPTGYAFEDHFVELRGVPPLLSFDRNALGKGR